MRITCCCIFWQIDRSQCLGDSLRNVRLDFQRAQRFSNDVEHALARIERGIRILENRLHGTAKAPHEAAVFDVELLAAKIHIA